MDFAAFLQSLGLRPLRAVVPDGRWHRCPTTDHPKSRNGAYKLTADGAVGFAQNWATDAEPHIWRAERIEEAAPLDYQAIRQRNEAADIERREAIQGARDYYARCVPLIGGHPYLEAHGLDMTGCRGLRKDDAGWLVVPMGAQGELRSIQKISPGGEKRFFPGAPTSGASYTLERRRATLTVLCEGLATGLALYAAVPQARVVVAFNAGNLPRVAARLPRLGMACVAADNDHETAARTGRNPGVDFAREAARLLGCEVAVPEGIAGTDWADLRQERLEAALDRVESRYETAAAALRDIDAELRRAVMAASRYLPVAG